MYTINDVNVGYFTASETLSKLLGVNRAAAEQIITANGGWNELLARTSDDVQGLTSAQKQRLDAARRLFFSGDGTNRAKITSPVDAARLLMPTMQGLDQEHLKVVLLDTKNQVIQITTVYIGSVNSAMVRVGEVFKEAVKQNAVSILVTHNHPSGIATPSPEDILVTRQIVEAGNLLDVTVVDHLIIGNGTFVSMRERGLGFPS